MFLRVLLRSFSSNFKPLNKIRVRTVALENVFSNNPEEIDWGTLRKELITSERSITPTNVDGIVLENCNKENRLDVAKSYLKFLKSQSLTINDVSICKLLSLFYRHYRGTHEEEKNQSISQEDEVEIIKISNLLIEKHQILNESLAKNTIHGLSLTREWKQCLKLLNHIQVTSTPTTSTYSCIILKALEENEPDIALKLLEEMFSKQLIPNTRVLLEYFSKFERDDQKTEKMLDALARNNMMIPERMIEKFSEVFNKTRECKIVEIDKKNGKCSSCSSKLPDIKLNESEFSKLSNTFIRSVMIRKDVFLKTTPDELNRFMSFIDKTVPYDCVIDGLNVAYSHGQQHAHMLAKNIASVVKYFVDRNQTCLVIGRKHMSRWPQDKMGFIRKNSSLFLADNLSHDDPFMLYAALKSGPHTKIFSRDLMRAHSYLLDNESKILFRRWQQQSQYSLITTFQNSEILVQEPITFERRAQKINSIWHIPFTSENINFSYETFEVPSRWLCVKFEFPPQR